jgi:integrase
METVTSIAQRWLALESVAWSETHNRQTRWRLDCHILPKWGKTHIADLDPADVSAWLNDLRRDDGQPYAVSSRQVIKATFSGLCQFAVDAAELAVNPIKRVKLGRSHVERPMPRVEDVNDTLAGIDDPRWHAMVRLAAVTGMRRGELCGLQWQDLEDGELHVRRSISREGTVQAPKTARSKRRIRIDDTTWAELLRLPGEKIATHYVFSGIGPLALAPDTVTQRWSRTRTNPDMHFHDLRHFAATQMLAGGFDVVTAAARLGLDPSVMLTRYAHAIPARDADAASYLAGVLEG